MNKWTQTPDFIPRSPIINVLVTFGRIDGLKPVVQRKLACQNIYIFFIYQWKHMMLVFCSSYMFTLRMFSWRNDKYIYLISRAVNTLTRRSAVKYLTYRLFNCIKFQFDIAAVNANYWHHQHCVHHHHSVYVQYFRKYYDKHWYIFRLSVFCKIFPA